jgi:hypothetical protein
MELIDEECKCSCCCVDTLDGVTFNNIVICKVCIEDMHEVMIDNDIIFFGGE